MVEIVVEHNGVEFIKHGDTLTVDIINALPFVAKLPRGYMNFMLNVNGGIPNKKMIDIKATGYRTTTCVDRFLGVTTKSGCNVLSYMESYKEYEGIIPDYMIPIAVDIGGNYIFLALKTNDKRGKIYYWDHDYAYHSDESYNPNIPILIANSFDEFLGKLYAENDATVA